MARHTAAVYQARYRARQLLKRKGQNWKEQDYLHSILNLIEDEDRPQSEKLKIIHEICLNYFSPEDPMFVNKWTPRT